MAVEALELYDEIAGYEQVGERTVLGIEYTVFERAGVQLLLSPEGMDALDRDPGFAEVLRWTGNYIARHGNINPPTYDDAARMGLKVHHAADDGKHSAYQTEATICTRPGEPDTIIKSYIRPGADMQYYGMAYVRDRLRAYQAEHPLPHGVELSAPAQLALFIPPSGKGTILMDAVPGANLESLLHFSTRSLNDVQKAGLRTVLLPLIRDTLREALGPLGYQIINDIDAQGTNCLVDGIFDANNTQPASVRVNVYDQPNLISGLSRLRMRALYAALGQFAL